MLNYTKTRFACVMAVCRSFSCFLDVQHLKTAFFTNNTKITYMWLLIQIEQTNYVMAAATYEPCCFHTWSSFMDLHPGASKRRQKLQYLVTKALWYRSLDVIFKICHQCACAKSQGPPKGN